MALSPPGYVSIVEIIVYLPALVAAIAVISRHGVHRASGWIYTLILCVVRISGAVCQLMTYHDKSEGLLKATLIIDSIGISPLLLATLGILSRFVDWINSRGTQVFSIKQFRMVQVLITLGLILNVVGGTSGSTSDGKVKVSTEGKVGIIFYIIAFAGMTFILVVSSGYRTVVPIQERRSPVAVAVAWPFILVRLTYSALATFLNDHTFSVVGGNVGIRVGMAVIEEWIVVMGYLALGFSLQKLQPEQQGELASRQWKQRKQERR